MILPSQAERLPAAPDRTPPHDASEIERVVVLYYGRDGSEHELTITASQCRGLVYSPDAP